jgi:predicted deacetylase
MIPSSAQYLIRFDDLCPRVSWRRWKRFLEVVGEHGIQPILAVVPDNRDPGLELGPPVPAFWERVRALESAGATIGLHGYQHLAQSQGRGLVPLHRRTEFAGVDVNRQRAWIRAGVMILRDHGLEPRIWVAPRHGFDWGTLRALREAGITVLSDGFTRRPFVRGGVTWIPQQLWEPVEKKSGLWTICVHPNTAEDSLVEELRRFIAGHRAQFTSVERVLAEMRPGKLEFGERCFATMTLGRILFRKARKPLRNAFGKPVGRRL